MTNPFQPATKQQLKARLALQGPTGSGKTWTALEWAQVLGQRIAVVDTERGSAALYSDHFTFDTLAMAPPYDPGLCVQHLRAAEANGYDVIVVDSLTHFWQGEGGTLDIKEAASKRLGNNDYAGWSVATPALRHLIDTMLGLSCHLIVTMRSKMDYVQDRDSSGKVTIRKVGMAPVMRDGVEYEFTLVGELDIEHQITVTKSRCSALADQVVRSGRAAEAAETFKAWLESGEPSQDQALAERRVALRRMFDALPAAGQEKVRAWLDRGGTDVDSVPPDWFDRYEELLVREASRPDDGGVANGSAVRESEGAAGDGPTASAASSEPEPPPPVPSDPAKRRKQHHALAGKAFPDDTADVREAKRKAVIRNCTMDRTDSSNDLTDDEMVAVNRWLRDIEQGLSVVVEDGEGGWVCALRESAA